MTFEAHIDRSRRLINSIHFQQRFAFVQRLANGKLTFDLSLLAARELDQSRHIGAREIHDSQVISLRENVRIFLLAYELLQNSNVTFELFSLGVLLLLL